MSVRNQPKIHEANRRPKGRHPLFYFISFIGIYYPLTDIVIIHIVYINETNHLRVCVRACTTALMPARTHSHAQEILLFSSVTSHTTLINTEVVARRHVPIRIWEEITLERRIRPELIGARDSLQMCGQLAQCVQPANVITRFWCARHQGKILWQKPPL
jgi:hypothetical protein